jgi:hypothetical protein
MAALIAQKEFVLLEVRLRFQARERFWAAIAITRDILGKFYINSPLLYPRVRTIYIPLRARRGIPTEG